MKLSELGVPLDHWCFVCGRGNPKGLHLDLDITKHTAVARFVPTREHTGWDEIVHGGIVTALLDEAMGWAIFHQDIWAVTTRLSVTFRRPIRVGEELRIVGRVERARGRAYEMSGEVRRATDDELLAEASALYVKMPADRRAELAGRYRDLAPALSRLAATISEGER